MTRDYETYSPKELDAKVTWTKWPELHWNLDELNRWMDENHVAVVQAAEQNTMRLIGRKEL